MNESAPEIRGATTGQDEGCARKQLIKCCHDWKNSELPKCEMLPELEKNSELSFFESLSRLGKLRIFILQNLAEIGKIQNFHSSKCCRDEPMMR